MRQYLKSYILFLGIAGTSLLLGSCDKLDTDYQQFLNDKELIYPGVPSKVLAHAGYKRVQLNWTPSPDPTVTKYVVYWNNNADSAVLNVPDGQQSQFSGGLVANLNEGTYFFTIHTYDKDGNKSTPIPVNNVKVYGDYYISGLVNRIVTETQVGSDGSVTILFGDPDATNISTTVQYTGRSDSAKTVTVSRSEKSAVIFDWKVGTPIVYRSIYKPTLSSIDSLAPLQSTRVTVKKDVSADFLRNYQQPFASVQNSDRFRDPAIWTVNDVVKNHNNKGGWGSDENTVLVMESGWGSPDIPNGKLYQTVMLPAGTYTINISLGSNGYSGPVKLVAVPGTTLPDFDATMGVPGAFGAVDIALRTMTFTVPSEQQVTIGFLANMVTGNQYWRIRGISLLRHY